MKFLVFTFLLTFLFVEGDQNINQKVETTTRYTPPTVPTACNPPCDPGSTDAARCDCIEQYECVGGRCQCNFNTQCRFDESSCVAECGCTEKCSCTNGRCLCDDEVDQCPFACSRCLNICGCSMNCEVSNAAQDTCVCKNPCACNPPPFVCPFPPSECTSNCGCEEKCVDNCFGNLCQCSPNVICP